MDLKNCILTRRSVRAYKEVPVPKELLARILDEARRSPSCANTQPWEFAVFGGQTMEEMRKAYQERFLSGVAPNPEIPYPFMAWSEPFRSRRLALSRKQYLLLGIDPSNNEQVKQYSLRGFGFFGAPNGIIIYISDTLPAWSILDVGIVLQTILLLAHSYGLGCCPQVQMVVYPDILRSLLKIPPSKKIVVGVSIGYPDEEDIINKGVTDRLTLDDMVTWHGIS
jgi:nitroreductase